MNISDRLIVSQLKKKEKAAFEYVFNEYYDILCNYSYKFLDEKEDAEEIVQDVFVKFWERLDSLSEDSSIKSYLFRSVHNSCLNFLKHQKVRDSYKSYIIQRMEITENPENEENPEDIEQEIHKAIESLPPQCRKIFTFSRFEGLKYKEIADHLGISVKTVEVQMGKALKILREKLKRYQG